MYLMGNKKIAFFIDYLNVGTFQLDAFSGVIASLPGEGVELYVFLGGAINGSTLEPYSNERNTIYELVTKDMFDGIIVITSVGNFASIEMFDQYLKRFENIPIIFLGPGP
jgi:hypothetical protein